MLISLKKHGNIIPLQGDVTSKESLKSIVEHIEKEDGYINVLIANSGVTGPTVEGLSKTASLTEFQSFFWAQTFPEFTNTYHVNTSAVFFSIIAFLPLLDAGNKTGNVEQKSQVIATSSIGGLSRTAMGGYAYGPSKAATTHLMKTFATSLVPFGIRSNVIAPGSKSGSFPTSTFFFRLHIQVRLHLENPILSEEPCFSLSPDRLPKRACIAERKQWMKKRREVNILV